MEVNFERQSPDSSAEERKWSVFSCAGEEAELESGIPGLVYGSWSTK